MDDSFIRFLELISFFLLIVVAGFTVMIAHYRHPLVHAKRSLYGLAWIAIVVAIKNFIVVLDIFDPNTVLAFGGIIVLGIVLWVIWNWRAAA